MGERGRCAALNEVRSDSANARSFVATKLRTPYETTKDFTKNALSSRED